MATIATHCGSVCHREHNIRNPKVVAKEQHIRPEGVSEVWHDEKPLEAYKRLFGDAIDKYNAACVKKGHSERQTSVREYYGKMKSDGNKSNPVYEMIIGVYGDVDDKTGRDIMKQFVDEWSSRNPNLSLVGAYYHADEEGKNPHVHIDYIPVARGYSKGLEVQNGLNKALEAQGFTKRGKWTPQMLWTHSENTILESMCKMRGIQVEHPERGSGIQHLRTETYKAEQHLLDVQKEAQELGDLVEQAKTLDMVKNRKVGKLFVSGKEYDEVVQENIALREQVGRHKERARKDYQTKIMMDVREKHAKELSDALIRLQGRSEADIERRVKELVDEVDKRHEKHIEDLNKTITKTLQELNIQPREFKEVFDKHYDKLLEERQQMQRSRGIERSRR